LFTGLFSLLVAAIYLAGLDMWSSRLLILRSHAWLSIGFAVTAMMSVLTVLLDNIFIARRHSILVTVRSLLFNLVKIAILLILVKQWMEGGVLASWALAMLVSLIIAGFLLGKALPEFILNLTFGPSSMGKLVKYSIVNNLASFFWSASATLLPLLVIQRLGAVENAYFYIAWAIASTLALIPSSISTSLFAEGSHQSEHLMEDAWRSIGMVLVIILPVIVIAVFLAKPVLSIFGSEYTNATTLFYWLAIALLPLSINQIYFGVLRVRSRLRELIILCALVMIVTVGGSYIFLPVHGLVAVGWAWFCGQTLSSLWVITGRKRLLFLLQRITGYIRQGD